MYTIWLSEMTIYVDANRNKHDIDSASDILQRYDGIAATIKDASRIGKN